jgi:uncharacterized membrane protein
LSKNTRKRRSGRRFLARETDLAAGDTSTLAGLAERAESPESGAGRRKASKLKIFALVFAVILFNAVGNLSLAWGMKHIAAAVSLDPLEYVRAMLNPFVALGTVLLILWLLTRMALLSWADLSFVLPLTGVGYVLAALLGRLFLNESVSPGHWVGTLLIFAGTATVGSTNQKTQASLGVGE